MYCSANDAKPLSQIIFQAFALASDTITLLSPKKIIADALSSQKQLHPLLHLLRRPNKSHRWLDFKYETILAGLRVNNFEFFNMVGEYLDGVENSGSATFYVQPFLEASSLSSIYLTIFVIFIRLFQYLTI